MPTSLAPTRWRNDIHGLLAALAGAITATIAAGGYPGIVLLMAIESACVPLPSEIIMPFAGYLAASGQLDLVLAATAGAVGCNVGSALPYAIGAYGGRPLVEKWGHYILLDQVELARADHFFRRWGSLTVLIARMLPAVRSFIALPAGIARMPQGRFHLYTFAGSWPWCFGLAYVGYRLGERWNSDPAFRALMHRADTFMVVAIALGAVWFVWRLIRHARRRNAP